MENQLAALKRESKDVVSEMQANEQISAAYDSVGKFRSATGTDKMLNATRDGLQESREKAAGAKVLYQSSRDGKLDKANAKTADYKINVYLESLKKWELRNHTYDIKDYQCLHKVFWIEYSVQEIKLKIK